MANLFDLEAKITLDTSKYERAVAQVVKSANKMQKSFESSDDATDTNKNRLKLLAVQYKEAQRVVEDLSREFNRSARTEGIASKKTEELAKKLDEAKAESNGLKSKIDALGGSAQGAGGKFQILAKGVAGAFGKGIMASVKLGIGTLKVGMAAIGAGATAVSALATAAVKSYAQYEQLVGGVETLFKDSSDKVMEYADNAFKTAGMSANQYMETVTSFAGSLLQSVGNDTEKASEIADMAITDMSDNANKMGTSMESIRHAYMGFSKQTFVMLDNLKLGYGGTKGEMERLLADAEKLSGVKYDISSYADIVEAIHVIQGEMEISGRTAEEAQEIFERTGRTVSEQLGTTAKEANETIQGSMSAAKAAWSNLITGLADDDADLGTLMDNAVQTTSTAFQNLLPAVEQSLVGIGQMVEEFVPIIMGEIPELINVVLPQLLESGVAILDAVIDGINDNLDLIMDAVFNIIETLAGFLIDEGPRLIEMGFNILTTLMNGIAENPEEIIDTVITMVEIFAKAIIDNLPELLVAGAKMLAALLQAFVDRIPDILQTGRNLVWDLIQGLWDVLPEIWNAGVQIVQSILDGILSVWDDLTTWWANLWDSLFGNNEVNVNVNATETVNGKKPASTYATGPSNGGTGPYKPGAYLNGSLAVGHPYIPFDGYIAELHKGERVLTADENRGYNNSRPINITVQSILDGRVIGESVTQYQRQKARAFG